MLSCGGLAVSSRICWAQVNGAVTETVRQNIQIFGKKIPNLKKFIEEGSIPPRHNHDFSVKPVPLTLKKKKLKYSRNVPKNPKV